MTVYLIEVLGGEHNEAWHMIAGISLTLDAAKAACVAIVLDVAAVLRTRRHGDTSYPAQSDRALAEKLEQIAQALDWQAYVGPNESGYTAAYAVSLPSTYWGPNFMKISPFIVDGPPRRVHTL